MPQRQSEVLIQFKPVPHNIFARVGAAKLDPNVMIINLQPEENIRVTVMAKHPGLDREGVKLREVNLDVSLSHSFAGERRRIAYEREIGRASCRARVCKSGSIRVGGVPVTKKK